MIKEKNDYINTEIIDCKKIAKDIRNSLIANNEKILCITNPDDDASRIYLKNKKKVCDEVGIGFEEFILDGTNNHDIDAFKNKVREYDGSIMVQLPIHKSFVGKYDEILNIIGNKRDVDGLRDDALVIPCTALGVINIIKSIKYNLQGKNVLLIGRSKLCNKSLINIMLKENATVMVAHSKTPESELNKLLKLADVVVCAVGIPHFLKGNMVKKNSVIIDVGINRDENGKLCGDCDTDTFFGISKYITPVPKGVGVLTTTCLAYNIIELNKLNKGE